MNIIDNIRSKLTKYPQVTYDYDDHSLTIPAIDAEGFNVAITITDQKYTVYFDGWHEAFDREEDALNCFAFGLSNSCRLKVHYKGDYPYKWVLEFIEDGTWCEDSTTGLFFTPFWRRSKVRYLQNHLIQD